ncbi:MAG: DNA polymerase III subunit epsilon [Sphingomonadales bacterium]|jgi:DNA polymerase-3 subunit epsilon
MREIVFDTETTGIDPYEGHRLVEIGCVELVNLLPTGKVYQAYVNPERDMPMEAYRVHGISGDFLKDKPVFSQIVEDLLEFIGDDSRLIAHNAEFDMRFINWELENVGFPPIPNTRVTDTLAMARRKFPGMRASLDNLCRRFNIDLSARTKHGALLDSELLAEVYLELKGGRQKGLELVGDSGEDKAKAAAKLSGNVEVRPARAHSASDEEKAAHAAFLEKLKDPIWKAP